jgi:CRP/FNR family transcriptional regulator
MENIQTSNSCAVNSRHMDCFELLSKTEKALLDNHRIELQYRPGETIIKQGAFFSNVVFLSQGLVKVYLEGDQKDLSLKIVPSNHFLGLSSLIDTRNQYIYSASAFIACKVVMYDKVIFTDIMKKNALFTYNIVNILNENTDQIYTRFYCMTCKQAHGKIADLLLCLSGRVFRGTKFDLPISKGEFADLIGLSPESVSRIFKQFKEENLIDIKGSTFELKNLEALEKISRFG